MCMIATPGSICIKKRPHFESGNARSEKLSTSAHMPVSLHCSWLLRILLGKARGKSDLERGNLPRPPLPAPSGREPRLPWGCLQSQPLSPEAPKAHGDITVHHAATLLCGRLAQVTTQAGVTLHTGLCLPS